jgi:hypothetical protein
MFNPFLKLLTAELTPFVYQSTPADGLRITQRTCLIMDEVDGMSSGDRGGVGALNQLIRQTRVCFIDVDAEVSILTASLFNRYLSF